MIKVSVIMPSLNVAGYIREAMDSVLAQTLCDIEVICVDAGSTDGTWEILEAYASHDSRIRLIKSDIKSYGYQMNLGIAAAVGEYIGIVETDDYIEADMYEGLYDAACKFDADIVKSDFEMFTKAESDERLTAIYSLKQHSRIEYDKVFSCDEYVSGRAKLEIYIWNAIYRRQFLLDNKVFFNESPGASFQDFSFRYQTCFFARRIVAVNRAYYHYRRDNAGASTYNPMTVEYNLRETKYTLDLLAGKADEATMTAFAREVVQFASWPYLEMMKWSDASEGTRDAFEQYRKIITKFMDEGYLNQDELDEGLWRDANLIIEGSDVYMGYAKVLARINAEKELRYIKRLSEAKDVVIFGTGYVGNAAYVFLRNNGLRNIRVFCDNSAERQGVRMYSVEAISPMNAVALYHDASFIVAVRSKQDEIMKQLMSLGVAEDNVTHYILPTDPAFCTNCMIKNRLRSET